MFTFTAGGGGDGGGGLEIGGVLPPPPPPPQANSEIAVTRTNDALKKLVRNPIIALTPKQLR
jgi:hypothetical protein